MKYRLLGRTGLYVSELCLGTMTFGDQGFWKVMGGLGQSVVDTLVKQAFDAGVNFIDTANVYSLGASESLTGAAIKNLGLPRDELVIATKAFGPMSETKVNGRGQSRYHLMNELDASLKRLHNMQMLDQLHGWKIDYDDVKQRYQVSPPANAKAEDLPLARAILSPRRKATLEK